MEDTITGRNTLDLVQDKGNKINQSSIEQDAILKLNNADTLPDNISEGLFVVKNGNQWLVDANKRPTPLALYLCLWYESEVCILFADTNLGKSILAVQIAIHIAQKHIVIYFDFELSDKQFENRYSENYSNHYNFPVNFYRAEINPDNADYAGAGFNNVEDYIKYSIRQLIIKTKAKVLVVDNLTYLSNETEKARDALPLMKDLKSLKTEFGLSILCLAHTPKRDLSKPLTRNDLQGSKMLINFCDSAFAIGESTKDKSIRYLKQIKTRNSEIEYDAENVAVYKIDKPSNFLHFKHIGFETEKDHLKQVTDSEKEQLVAKVKDLKSQQKTQREIADILKISLGSVNNYLKK